MAPIRRKRLSTDTATKTTRGGSAERELRLPSSIQFKDRGTDELEWRGQSAVIPSDKQNLRRFQHPALSIAEETPIPGIPIRPNPTGLKKGYDPYDSGRLSKVAKIGGRRDLRRLGEWLKASMRQRKTDRQ
jgi:hypothetical protein